MQQNLENLIGIVKSHVLPDIIFLLPMKFKLTIIWLLGLHWKFFYVGKLLGEEKINESFWYNDKYNYDRAIIYYIGN